MAQKLFVFWESSGYPYCLGAELIEFHEEGKVSVKGYQGFRFKPILVLPYKEGLKIHIQLKKLENDYKSAKSDFESAWKAKLPSFAGK